MADVFTVAKRSEVMRGIRSKNTKPEQRVRRALHELGYRFRLHDPELPSRPDIVLKRHRVVIQVQGCFWHGHSCLKGRLPASNSSYWGPKLARNKVRDARNNRLLRSLGWRVHTIWECQTRKWTDARLRSWLESRLTG
jgi:DNA mismatch endonuclease (patch repair protein)